jgi:ABC-type phosphate transport system substrate-binding protein
MMKQLICTLVLGLGGVAAQAADLVVIANPAVGALTKDQVADLYLGKSQAYNPVDLAEASPLYAEFYKKATGRDVAQVKSTWSRIVFSGKGQAPKQVADAAAVKKAVAADPKGIGYIEKSAVDGTVKTVLALD